MGTPGMFQGLEVWETIREWIDRTTPRFRFSSAEGYYATKTTTDSDAETARSFGQEVICAWETFPPMESWSGLPTTAELVSPLGQRLSVRQNTSLLTCIVGTLGALEISLPLAEVDHLPAGLSLIGRLRTAEPLIAFTHVIADAMK